MKKRPKILIVLFLAIFLNGSAQDIFVNRVFQDASGSPLFNPVLNPLGVQWTKSIHSISGGIITVGYTTISGQGQNIHLIKYNPSGSIAFQKNFNTSGSNNDYGLGVFEASNGDVYVCGSTDNGGTTNYDLVVLRYSSTGTFLNSNTRNGPANGNDAGVSIIKDASGNIFVAGNTADALGFSNMWVLKFTSTLGYVNSTTYDYAGLNDFALGLTLSTSGNLSVIGPSASGPTSCDYVQANFNPSSLAFVSQTRSNVPGTALDQALDFCKDANDNTYITGKAWNGSNFDIKTIKINANFTLGWTVTQNPNGMEDAGVSITTDGTGNIIVGGFVTKPNGIKDLICLKHNSSTGALIWQYRQSAINPAGDAIIKQVCTNPANNDVYFIAGEESLSGLTQVLTTRLSSGGQVRWQRRVEDSSDDILPSDIKFATDGVYIISVLDSVTDHYLTTKYQDMELDTARKFLAGIPVMKNREVLVSFNPSSMNQTAMDNESLKFGDLSDLLTATAYSTVKTAFTKICRDCKIQAVKVYEGLKSTDVSELSRLGTSVPITPTFWSTLLLQFPNTINAQQAMAVLKTIPNIATSCQYNTFMETTSVPNDSLYNQQGSLHAVSPNVNAHINVEEAWDVTQGCGASFVRGGVFDTGVEYRHRDFGYVGPATNSFVPQNFGKVKGYHFANMGPATIAGGIDLWTQSFGIMPDPMGHGTAVAGIIGAQRNNTSGVAGIAGGNAANNNSGVSLYSMNTQFTNMANLLNAMYYSCRTPVANGVPYRYALHFSNHSYKMVPGWWPPDSFPLLKDVVHFQNRMNVTFVASRGNDSINNHVVPANYDPNWVISVGGSDVTGGRWIESSYGSNMDVIAPADSNITIKSMNSNVLNVGWYQRFAGTSAAAPHVSGVVALLMSYLNDTVANYKNLAPEDCDNIIQKSATNLLTPGYDSLTGFGRLNAGQALRLVEKPARDLIHYGTNSWTPHTISKFLYNNWDTIRLTERYTNASNSLFLPGKYVVKTWVVNATVAHNLTGPTDSLMYYWPRHSMSNVFDLPTPQKKFDAHERVIITACNGGGALLTGYIYQVKDSLGNPVGWWPCDTSFSALNSQGLHLMEYTVLTRNKLVGIYENEKDNQRVEVFPNPASNQQTLIIDTDKPSNCTVDMFDLMGRHLKTVYIGKVHAGKNSILNDLDGLPSSMYIYTIKLDDNTLSKKFIKD